MKRDCDKINGRNALAVYYMKITINGILRDGSTSSTYPKKGSMGEITSIQGQCGHK